MATKDTGGQRQNTRRAEEAEETESGSVDEVRERHEKLSDDVDADVQESDEVRERQDKLTDDVDAILDEIDEVLEENAEEFVRSYVQKGGQ